MAGAPTKKELAEKRMQEIETIMKSKIPSILQSGLKRMEDILKDKDAADSIVCRIVEYATKELKDLNEQAKVDGSSEEITPETEQKPKLSLLSSN